MQRHYYVDGTCNDPASSVLFDGHIPKLTGLDGDMWASQLLTIERVSTSLQVLFYFTTAPSCSVMAVEVVAFTCPEWDIGAVSIGLFDSAMSYAENHQIQVTSCEHLVRYCIQTIYTRQFLALDFLTSNRWLHLAEVRFHTNSSACPHDTVITPTPPPTTTPPPATTSPPSLGTTNTSPPSPTSQDNPPTCSTPTQCEVCLTSDMVSEVCPFSSTTVILASVITAIVTALLTTVIFVLVLIAVCKCHPKFTPGGAETGTSAGEGEGQEYEQMDTGEGGVAVSDPTYMEVGAAEGKTFELKQNEAYATRT